MKEARRMNPQEIIEKLAANRKILRDFEVNALYLFGSVSRNENRPDSDVDLLVEFESDAGIGLFEFAQLRRLLSELLGCKVDLATPDALHRELRERIMREAVRAA